MKVFRSCGLKAAMIVAAMLVLGSTVAYAAQSPDQIVKFGPGSPPPLEDSIIFEDPISGNIGIGTTTPAEKLDVTGGNVNLEDSTATTGNILKGGLPFIHNFGLGLDNTFIGKNAGNLTMTGFNNTAMGASALHSNTTGFSNTASGVRALFNNTFGVANTASGDLALENNTTGDSNTASGEGALQSNTAGFSNTATGAAALKSNSIGSANTASGVNALFNNIGSFNIAIGAGALFNKTFGDSNIAIGSNAGVNLPNGDTNIYIGHPAPGVAEFNTIRIGEPLAYDRFFAAGIRGVTTGLRNALPVLIDSDGQLGTINSSRRFKEEIREMGEASSGLMRLRPVTFRYKKAYADGSRPLDYGLIAEEVAEVYPDLVVYSSTGEVETVQYHKLNVMLLNEVQKQQGEIQEQRQQIHEQAAQIAELKGQAAENSDLKARLETLEGMVKGTQTAMREATE